jgi:prepilin-type N-terminal cleavage/methylation domain-containing protein
MNNQLITKHFSRGFSLLEMAVVLIILGFVLGAILAPIQAQRQQLAQSQTESTLEIAKKALIGFAQSKGRLPCPATLGNGGAEQPLGGGACTQQVGLLPAVTLGIQPVDSNGFVVDAWNNPIRYAITQNTAGGAATPDFTTSSDMANVGISLLAPDLRVCATSIAASCTATVNLTSNAVAVIYSLGATGSLAIGGADETENLNAVTNVDTVFVSHESRAAVGNEFDHMVVWISPYVLYNAMIEAGQLH